jgi:hypothetical protein
MWLLQLYPRPWRERYGDEMAELLHNESLSPSLVIDVLAGAVDAWLNPQLAVSAPRNQPPEVKEHETMFAKMLQLRCAGHGPSLSVREQRLSIALTLGSALALTVAWMWVAVTYRDPQVRQYVLAFSQLPFFASLILTMPLRSMKGRSRATQAVLMSACFVLLVAWCVVVGFVATMI